MFNFAPDINLLLNIFFIEMETTGIIFFRPAILQNGEYVSFMSETERQVVTIWSGYNRPRRAVSCL
jgi:hypothetical protein